MSNLWGSYFQKLDVLTEGKTSAEDLDYAVHASLKYKYIFVETPKVACSTIKTTLQRLELEDPEFVREQFEDLHVREFSSLLKLHQLPNFENYLTRDDFTIFCFVRNPYNRFLSCYLDKIEKPIHVTEFKQKVLKSMGLDEGNIEQHVSFEDFVTVVENQSSLEMDYHWRTQTYLTCHNKINYNFIGKLESFESDFFTVGKRLSVDFEKYYTSVTVHQRHAGKQLEKYYTDDLYSRVYKIYEVDFDSFSYNR